jgi:hypothetical protein
MLRRSALLAALVAAGCGQPSPPPAASPEVVVAPQPAAPPTPPAPAVPPKAQPPAPPPAFQFPTDTAGQALPKIVTPQAPALPPTERAGLAPVTRTPPARVTDPAPPVKVRYAPPPLLPTKAVGLKPAAPAERVPLDFGFATAAVSGRPTLPVAAGVTQKAPDVTRPPGLPLGRQVPDRASLDDPTAEPANAAVVGRSSAPALPPAGFLKVTLPDPFELAGQVKPMVAPTAEPGLAPVAVSPQRPK